MNWLVISFIGCFLVWSVIRDGDKENSENTERLPHETKYKNKRKEHTACIFFSKITTIEVFIIDVTSTQFHSLIMVQKFRLIKFL
jgi:hypothetical protein